MFTSVNSIKTFATAACDDILFDKFKGCLIGALIGDCYGKPYKFEESVSQLQLQKYFDKLNGPYFKAPFKPYSGSTAFSTCIGESLLENNVPDPVDTSRKFVKTYFDNPYRGYGKNITAILVKLRGSKFADPFAPAKETYLGLGSFGNKAAARVSPIALFYFGCGNSMAKVASQTAELTHSHKQGRDGAILQSWAIRLALGVNEAESFCPNQYLSELKHKVNIFESDEENLQLSDAHRFKQQLDAISMLLNLDDPTADHVVNTIGHGQVAVYSIPTAIYCFLRSVKPIPGIDTSNSFRRTVQYAISLGGDTEAIAGMAGAIAGACYGLSNINESLYLHCEGAPAILQLAEKLYTHRFMQVKS